MRGFPLSPRQRRLWDLAQEAGPGQPVPAVRCRVALAGAGGDAVGAALERLVARHPALRTGFHRPAGSRYPIQVVAERAAVDWDEVEGDAVEGDAGSAALEDLPAPPVETGGPALRARWLGRGDDQGELLLALPALRADADSLEVLVRELVAICAGAPPQDEGLEFARVAEWQNELLAEAEADEPETVEFWRRQMEAPAWEPMPGVGSAAEQGRAQGGTREEGGWAPRERPLTMEDGAGVVDGAALDRLAAACGARPEAVLLALWAALLGRLGGRRESVVGVLFPARDYEALEAVVGPLETCLPIRLDMDHHQDPQLNLATLAGRAAALLEQAEEIHEGLRLEPPPEGRSHLAAGFAWRELPEDVAVGPVSARWQRRQAMTERFDVELLATRRGAVVELALRHDEATLAAADAALLGQRLGALLARLEAAPDLPLGRWDLLAEAERRQLLGLAAGEPAAPADRCLHDLFAEHLEGCRDAVAVEAAGIRLTHGELDERSRRLARRLLDLGVEAEEPVGLLTGRSPALAVGLLGILRAGGAYVPLDPTLPPARLAVLGQAVGLRRVVVEAELAGLPELPAEAAAVALDADGTPRDGSPQDEAPGSTILPAVLPQQLAYVLFTSGSTGVPKPVAVEHRQAVAYLRAITARLGLAAGESYAMVSTLGADLGLTSLLPALFAGGRLLLFALEETADASAFAARAGAAPGDLLKIVPSHLRALLDAAADGLPLPRRVVLGGEALGWDLVERLGGVRVWNHYGPSETTVGALAFPLPEGGHGPDSRLGSRTVPLGTPLAGYRVHLLDARGGLAPLGAAGEIAIGGAGVSRGYRGRPSATAERFLPDPFAGQPGQRLYRTGDLGRRLPGGEVPGGEVEFLGRIDDQAKIRGFRIEPGEVASVLEGLPQVRAATVAARPAPGGGRRLVAWFVPADGDVDGAALRESLASVLPDYMVPAAWVRLDRLPLTANGKLDRGALPEPEEGTRRERIPPQGSVEEVVALVWNDLLGDVEAGRDDDFFRLGGHSLLAMQVVARLREVFEVPFSLGDLFDGPTVRQLAATLVRREATPGQAGTAARIFLRVRSLDPEQAERLLAERRSADETAGTAG